MRLYFLIALLLYCGLALLSSTVVAQDSGTTLRVSVASDGAEGNGDSKYPAISADGRLLAFTSRASNLVADDSSPVSDVFVHERATGTTRRVSVASDGSEANSLSHYPSLSADGRYVVFWSRADNLVDYDMNGKADVFVHDIKTAQTTLVSLASDGTQGNSASAGATLSADGRYVAFSSLASNLVENDTNGWWDVFVKDRQSGRIVRVSVASDGTQGNENSSGYDPPSISADGTVVTFWSLASNLVENDTSGYRDVFAHDLTTGQTTRVSVASDGTQGNYHSSGFVWPIVSADGRTVVFMSDASNLVKNDTNSFGDIFVHDLTSRESSRVSVASDGTQANDQSWAVSLSADGQKVAFHSSASNLVDNDTNWLGDIFVHDRDTGQTTRISVASDGTQGSDGASLDPAISADGRVVAFWSWASNLVEGDTNDADDVFVHVRPDETATPTVTLTSTQSNTPTPTNTIPPKSETPTSTTTSTETPNTETPTSTTTPTSMPTATPSSTLTVVSPTTTTVTATLIPSPTPTLMPSPSATTSYRLYLPLLLH